jgi:diguanylate cyclase (GGDEF)-like protein
MAGLFCGLLIMIGTFASLPGEKVTRYWASSAVSAICAAMLLVGLFVQQTFLLALLTVGTFFASLTLNLWGFQAFYHTDRNPPFGPTAVLFFSLFAALYLWGAPPVGQVMGLISGFATIMWFRCLQVVWRNRPARLRFAEKLVLSALVILMVNNVMRMVFSVMNFSVFFDTAGLVKPLGLFVLYFLPMFGTLMMSVAIVLLYCERLVDQTNHAATHDELTGVLNRRAIVASGEHEIEVALRHRQTLAVAFVDIDFFKRINDQYGHATGDHVLAEVAQVLAQTCRAIDRIGRYGGEEFCMVFPVADASTLALIGERLVTAVRLHTFADLPQATVSVGLALFNPESAELTWQQLVHLADLELYKAKAGGRDQYRANVSSQATPAEEASGQARRDDVTLNPASVLQA